MFKQMSVVALLVVGACVVWSLGAAVPAYGAETVTGVVNINTATVDELAQLPFIGPAKAQRIIDYRTANGPFQKVEDLMNVSGIGEKTFLRIKDYLTITGQTTLKAS